jgi:hydroxymethylglutaryl-CoA reductase (NADPH)
MDLRSLPPDLSPKQRTDERRKRVQDELNVDLSCLEMEETTMGSADEKNCEQMIGSVPLPVGIAGPLNFTSSDKKQLSVFLPLGTTEGALVASVNRGCKALSLATIRTESEMIGVTRSLAFHTKHPKELMEKITETEPTWKPLAEATSKHLKILSFEVEQSSQYVFLTIAADTDEAMGMNMITIATEAAGNWISENLECEFVTVAANVDSDKKPSLRTYEHGRGIEAVATAEIPESVLTDVLKTDAETMLQVADAKLTHGSQLAQAIGSNLHAANVIAALYLATGQDAAHIVEGSLTDTLVEKTDDGIRLTCRCPALMIGVRGGGTELPAQKQCLGLLLKHRSSLHPRLQFAETIAAAVLAGELSLLAAQAGHTLGQAHRKLGR